ncbi:MAG: response regulator transcription factor [Eubacterium sp.]|jgi:DNA-binding response OmpR family regulator|uniref:response regulator transcription factor n=1 Tax=Clostridium sp. (strain SY8519) TaxID=1042156 RepID=UPI0002171CFB|nr:response regulator transcription factor [Clostridium sp. SY8519]BAK47677.1 hypothetical protein CXIVA_17110 [Clostridium sp. SY8519]
MTTILLVEDDPSIVKSLKEFLSVQDMQVTCASGQKEAFRKLEQASYDLILLDITLPDGSGYSICNAVKETYGTPVIFLTASGDENSVVTGFDLGADDYIAKPFRPRELLSRIRNVLRRCHPETNIQRVRDLTVDLDGARVSKNGQEILLSGMEYRLLGIFLDNRGRILSRQQLLEAAWDFAGDFVNDNTLSVYIKRLREKIETDPQNPVIITTVRGLGYRMD